MRNTLAVLLSVISLCYFLPTTVAIIKRKTDTTAIFLLNLFLGITGVGWIIALVWAAKQDIKYGNPAQ
jgi:uncharacterized membrane protein YhaH (DUF805 family)